MNEEPFRSSLTECAMNYSKLLEQAMQSITAHQSLWEKAMAAMPPKPTAIEQAMQSITAYQSLWEKAMASMPPKPTAIEQAMQSITAYQSLWQKTMAAMPPKPTAIELAMQSITAHQSLWEKAMAAIPLKPKAIEQVYNIITSRNIFLEQPDIISVMAETIAQFKTESSFSINDFNEVDEMFSDACEDLSIAPNSISFLQKFKNIHPSIQIIIVFLFFQIIIPQLNNISANLITPYVKSYLNNSESEHRKTINHIKKIPWELKAVDTKDLRFITGDNVRLRKLPSTKSEILDEMILGQVVTVLSKKKNWIKIKYEYENGELMVGWVFTRYTAKFKK